MARLVPQTHAALHTIAEEVPLEEITSPRIKKVLADMRAALHSYKVNGYTGIAIAAPQIGVPLRIFLIEDMSEQHEGELRLPSLVAINPRIVRTSKESALAGEGCLSVPEVYGKVKRARRATLRAYDEHGVLYERGGSDLLAQVFQHEVDHLDGILFVDRATEIFDKKELDALREDAVSDITADA